MSGRAGRIQRSRRDGVERGDTGLGRDAYGPPRHERDRHGYGPEPYPSDDGYPVEDDDAAVHLYAGAVAADLPQAAQKDDPHG